MDNQFAKVIQVIDDYEVVINKGLNDDISKNDNFLIYNLGEELFDPDSKESLGYLEIVCGRAKVKHLQDKMTTLDSNIVRQGGKKIVRKASSLTGIFGPLEEVIESGQERVPFNYVDVGSLVKKV
ncbi:MAG: hypothetical protein FWD96_01650 [Defluviitaleaceae bacterium]|nr:hypothetical protein [Defluviitaleaceae bacterium]